MGATILAFPKRPADQRRLALIGEHLRDSFEVPGRDKELALLIQMAESLVSNINEVHVDRFLDRLDEWERENQTA